MNGIDEGRRFQAGQHGFVLAPQWRLCFCVGFLLIVTSTNCFPDTTIVWSEDFESGQVGTIWRADNGIWEIGAPGKAPGGAFNGVQAVATGLNADYPEGPDSILVGPPVDLPAIADGQELLLRYWQWFSYSAADQGNALMQVYDAKAADWGAWQTLKTITGYVPEWHHERLDLSAYAGQRIRLGFQHVDNTERDYLGHAVHAESSGWVVDDIEILEEPVPRMDNPEGFEAGWGGWYSSNGIWEIGMPANGPGRAFAGTNVMAVRLAGKYPYGPDSMLISPVIDLPAIDDGQELLLRYWQWFSYAGADSGSLWVLPYDAATGSWGAWERLETFTGYVPDWHHERIDLSAYAGRRIRVGFQHVEGTELDYLGRDVHAESSGWFLDEIEVLTEELPAWRNPEGFESGWGGWYSTHGVWEIGSPSNGPGRAFGGMNVMGVRLAGNYPYGPESTLISPKIDLPPLESGGEELQLRYHEWHSYSGADQGNTLMQVYDPASQRWGGWQTLRSVTGTTPDWRDERMDLTEYAGKTIRLGFQHIDGIEFDTLGRNVHSESSGWLLDNVEILETALAVPDGPFRFDENTPVVIPVSSSVPGAVFGLGGDAPEGARVDPASGRITWLPSECQGPSTNTLIVTLSLPNSSLNPIDLEPVVVVINEVNESPVLENVPPQPIRASQELRLDLCAFARDVDCPAQILRFSLDACSPAGATIDPASCELRWTPTAEEVATTPALCIRVTDEFGLSATQTVVVEPAGDPTARPVLTLVRDGNGGLKLQVADLDPGATYIVDSAATLPKPTTWIPLLTNQWTGSGIPVPVLKASEFLRLRLPR